MPLNLYKKTFKLIVTIKYVGNYTYLYIHYTYILQVYIRLVYLYVVQIVFNV